MSQRRLLFCLFSLLLGTAAAPKPADYEGKPSGFVGGSRTGAALWLEQGRLHVDFASRAEVTLFTGKVCSRTRLEGLETRGLQASDSVKLGPKGRCVHLKLQVDQGLVGFSFAFPNEAVIVDLRRGIKQLEPASIWLGRNGIHPESSPFALPASSGGPRSADLN